MKRWLLIVALLALPIRGQTTAVTATVAASTGQVWANGTFGISWIPVPGQPGPYYWQGSPFVPQIYNGVLNGSGTMTVTLPDTSTITPVGSKWAFVLCANTSAPCSTITIPVIGASQNYSALFSASVTPPLIYATPLVRAYTTAEVPTPPPLQGGQFWNVTSNCEESWTGIAWEALCPGVVTAEGTYPIEVNGASGVPAGGTIDISCPACGAPAPPSGTLQYDNGGVFGATNGDWNTTESNVFVLGTIQGSTVSAWACNGTDCTLTAANNYVAGQSVLTGPSFSNACMDNAAATVLSAGLSGSQFEIAQSSTTCSGTVSGTGGTTTSGWAGLQVNSGEYGIGLSAASAGINPGVGQISIVTSDPLDGLTFGTGAIFIETTTGGTLNGSIDVGTVSTGSLSGNVAVSMTGSSGGGQNFSVYADDTVSAANESSAGFGVELISTNRAFGGADADVSFDSNAQANGANFSVDMVYSGPSGGGAAGHDATFEVETNGSGPGSGNILLSADNTESPGDGNISITTTGPFIDTSSNMSVTSAGVLSLQSLLGGCSSLAASAGGAIECSTGASYFTVTLCNPAASSNINNCTGTASLPVTFADTAYQLVCTTFTTGNGSTFLTVTAKTTSAFSYINSVMQNNGSSSQPTTADCVAHHN